VSDQTSAGSREDLQWVIDRSPVPILAFHLPDQRIRAANSAVAVLTGFSQSALVGQSPGGVWEGTDGQRSHAALSDMDLGVVDSYLAHGLLRTTSGPLPVAIWARRVETVGESIALVVIVPETEARSATRSIRSALGTDASDIVGMMSVQGRIESVYPEGASVLGWDKAEVVGVDLGSLVHPDDIADLKDMIEDSAQTANGAVVNVRMRHATRGWTETRCLFFPVAKVTLGAMAFVVEESHGDLAGPDTERIASLERHLLRFAAELHAGGWNESHPLAVDASHFAALDQLPRRQRQIVDRLLRGEGISSIAASMFISPSTVRNHLSHVYAVFGVHGQSELLARLRSRSDAPAHGEPRRPQ
jgi:DNA-binding CsgD family transcriptional regulator/PAS domain-containing protein